MKYITLEMLEQAKACADQQRLFKATFGTKAELTTANMAKAMEVGLHVEWFTMLLPQTIRDTYEAQRAPLRGAYEEERMLLWKDYEAQQVPLLETYKAQRAPLWKAYKAKQGPLWKDYEDQREPLLEAYRMQEALLWKTYEEQRNTLLLNELLTARRASRAV